MIYADLIKNLALLVAISVVSGFIGQKHLPRFEKVLQGLLFGTAAVLGMLSPLVLGPGLIFDGRSVMISLCGLFFGPLATGIAASMSIVCRILQGGPGMYMGVLTVLCSAVIGMIFHRHRRHHSEPSTCFLWIFGLLVHAAMVLMMTALPPELMRSTFQKMAVPILLFYPLATVLAGKILSDQQARIRGVHDLRLNREELRTTLYSIGDGVISTDKAGRIRQMNPSAEHLTGWSRSEAEGEPLETVFRIIHETTGHSVESPVQRALKTGKTVGLANHTLLIAKDGSKHPIADSAAPIFSQEGTITGVVLVFRDQTGERAAEKTRLQAEQQWKSTFDAVSDAICLLDLNQTIIRCNHAMTVFCGRSKSELIGMSCYEAVHQVRKPVPDCPVTRMMLSKQRESLEMSFGSRCFEVTADPLLDGSGTLLGAVHILRDITKRKSAEERLRRIEWMVSKKPAPHGNESFEPEYGDLTRLNQEGLILRSVGYDTLKRIAGDYMALLGTSSAIYEANGDYAFGMFDSGWCRLMDHASWKLCGTPDLAEALSGGKWLCHESCWKDCSKKAIETGAPVDIECAGGIHLYALPIVANSKVIGAINFGYGDPPRDPAKLKELAERYSLDYDELKRMAEGYDSRPDFIINMAKERLQTSARLIGLLVEVKLAAQEQKTLEQQLVQSQKMEAIGQLAGGIAHDFNNMLQVILGRTDILLNDTAAESPHAASLREIFKAAQRSADLTRQLLAFARKQTIAPERIDLNLSVSTTLDLLRRLIGENIDLHWIPSDEPLPVQMDPAQLNQILTNLTVNARDAIQTTGQISIETGPAFFDEAYCLSHSGFVPGAYARLSVSDTGCGMDKETCDHIFEPFFTTKRDGLSSGLGLATLYGIVRQNKGFINLYSEPGRGSVFRIYLPLQSVEGKEPKPAPSGQESPHGKETLLFVEDEETLLSLGRMQLEDLGYTVLSSARPEEALHLAREYKGDIDLLITDVVMPGMSGLELSKEIIRQRPGIRLLFMSGYTADIISNHGVLDEGLQFLQKPFSKEELARKIRTILATDGLDAGLPPR